VAAAAAAACVVENGRRPPTSPDSNIKRVSILPTEHRLAFSCDGDIIAALTSADAFWSHGCAVKCNH
jgi:hypothetical protein